ncbi:RuBisCO large subunit C-terminal-like domain-containing protein [Candidatus Poribacteria bacterium]
MEKYVPVETRGREPLEIMELDSQHDPEDSILFIYYIKTQSDLVETAKKIAEEETTGRWIGNETPTQVFYSAQADVCKIEKYGEGEGIIYVRSPLGNLDMESDLFYQIAMLSVGGPILEFVYYENVAYLDFQLPQKVIDKFPGPKFGIQGTREIIGLEAGKPAIGTIIKPCCGLTPEESAEKCYQAALGGAVLIKDDEKMMGPQYCPFEKKVRLVSEALRRAEDETGKKTIYAPHLTARPDKIKDMAMKAIEYGATGVMFNAILANNLGTVEILAEDPDVNVPIYVHSGGRSALSTGPRRIDDVVTAKLTRLCGGDYFQIGVMGQLNVHVASRDPGLLLRLDEVFKEPITGIKDTVPVTAGGLGAANVGKNIQAFGYDLAPLAGSNVLDHPMGPKAGSIAMNQAVEAYTQEGITEPDALKEYANRKEYKELQAIL